MGGPTTRRPFDERAADVLNGAVLLIVSLGIVALGVAVCVAMVATLFRPAGLPMLSREISRQPAFLLVPVWSFTAVKWAIACLRTVRRGLTT